MNDKYVLGIDVGIKSLSLCILSKTCIHTWGVYDILEDEIPLCSICGRKAKYKDGLCGTHYKGAKLKKNEIKIKKVKQYTQHELCKKIILLFDGFLSTEIFDKISDIVIELQPRFNPRMCFVSNVIFTKLTDYYLLSPVNIKFDKAKNKLSNYTGKKGEFTKNTYKNRKLKSIEYVTSELLKYNDQCMIDYFSSLKKQDDASDSFLIALQFI